MTHEIYYLEGEKKPPFSENGGSPHLFHILDKILVLLIFPLSSLSHLFILSLSLSLSLILPSRRLLYSSFSVGRFSSYDTKSIPKRILALL